MKDEFELNDNTPVWMSVDPDGYLTVSQGDCLGCYSEEVLKQARSKLPGWRTARVKKMSFGKAYRMTPVHAEELVLIIGFKDNGLADIACCLIERDTTAPDGQNRVF